MDWLDRVLAHEDLSGDERRQVEERLDRDPAARLLLERVRAAERAPGPGGQLPPFEQLELSASDLADAERSLRELVRRVLGPEDRPVRGHGSWLDRFRGLFRPMVFVPVGVVALALVILLRPGTSLEVGPLSVDQVARVRGGEKSGWQEGDAFRLRCDVSRPVVPVVFHVDPGGRISLLHPESPEGPFERSAPAAAIVLPDPASEEEWVLDGAPGRETFLLAAWGEAPGNVAALIARLEKISAGAADREGVVANVRAELESTADEVRVAEISRD